jgi:RNA polymerase sigma-70 factor (ECF subfamily)
MDHLGERLARGDRAAFAELYDACAGRVHRFLVARLGSMADADDVLQETFVRLARDRSRLGTVANLPAYIVATARNEANRLLERRGREGRRQDETGLDNIVDGETSGLHVFETAELVAVLLARLDSSLREIVELKVFGALTFREISELTGLPQGTVATRYRSALETMRSQPAKE